MKVNLPLILAWRNLWRNKKRTLITCSSIVFAVILAVLLNSLKEGILVKLQENTVNYFYGPIQIQALAYQDDKSLENTFEYTSQIDQQIRKKLEVNAFTNRLESFALSASDDKTKACMIVGIEPAKEDIVTQLKSKLIEGTYIDTHDQEVMISSGLSEKLHIGIQDTIVVIGQGYRSMSAAGKYPVKGILKFASPELNKRLIYMPLSLAQDLFRTGDRITSTVISIKKIQQSEKVSAKLASALPGYNVLNWKEMLPELDELIRKERAENVIFLGVLYLLISFGIFGTILMMLYERQYEFGVLNAIGLRNSQLSKIVVLENIFISLMGAFIGLLLSFPIVYYFYLFPIEVGGNLKKMYEDFGFEPIFYFSIEPRIFYSQTVLVLVIALILSFYPILKIMRLDPIQAMRT